ncbi:hypothetical protein N7454_008255 [Penicillium verhagenii]|nr:hypothetical protein N7454_008255 [Penicillium verhagenii]
MARSRPSARASSSRPVRQNRTQVASYHEDSTSDERDQDENSTRRHSLSLRPRATQQTHQSYREKSTDESLELSDDHQLNDRPTVSEPLSLQQAYPASASATSRAPQRTRRAAPSRVTKTKRVQPKSRALGQPLKKRPKVEPEQPSFVGSGVIPPWQTLPYHILIEIFLRAFYPLDDPKNPAAKPPGKSLETRSAHNLLGIALLCRGFSEAALAALYYRPPIFSAYNGHSLLNILSKPLGSQFINYAGKIRELDIDAETVLTLKSGPTLGYFDLLQLLQKTPRLHTLRLYHPDDVVLGNPSVTLALAKWNYSDSFFSALDQSTIKLRSWEWNGRFFDTASLLPLMLEKHMLSSFQTLQHIRLVHLLDNDRIDTAGKEGALAAALKALPDIERLEIHECSLLAGSLLEQLPPTLRSLTISGCDRIVSCQISQLLKVHGGQLVELALNHNRHLNMEFIPGLGVYCPRLERFKVDMSMHDTSSYHDLEPHFKRLLYWDQVPTWPETIQEIELYQLRHWNSELGEMFFTSLVQAAPKLKNLRRVEITAIVGAEWRDRAQFRMKWVHRLTNVFMRRSPSSKPQPPLSSKAIRHSSRLAQQNIPQDTDLEEANPSDPDNSFQYDDSIQGMCEYFTIRIDNQRPNDIQYNENDFLDDEISGDEDWHDDDFEPEDGHAW